MKTRELLQDNPVASKIINKYYVGILADSIANNPDLPENYRQFLEEKGIGDIEIAVLIDSNPRLLVDVFDMNNLYACLDMQFVDGAPIFGVNIDGAISEQKFQNRKEAEKYMVTECIKFLNNKTN